MHDETPPAATQWWQMLSVRLMGLAFLAAMAGAGAMTLVLFASGSGLLAMGGVLLTGGLCAALAWWASAPLRRLVLHTTISPLHTADERWALALPSLTGEAEHLANAWRLLLAQNHQQMQHMQADLSHVRALLLHADVGLALTQGERFVLVSHFFSNTLRCQPSDLIQRPAGLMFPSPAAWRGFLDRTQDSFAEFGAFEGELELQRTTGERFWAHVRARAINPQDPMDGAVWMVEDVTQAREQRERLTWHATHDALTGIANRHAFEAALGKATALAHATPFAALFIDLDRFKQVNDHAGHAAGDALLVTVARRLESCVRQSDTVARLGGDEFAVLLPRCPHNKALELAEKMRHAVEDCALEWEGQTYHVGASVGLVYVDGSFDTNTSVLRAADRACYAAKRGGRNQVVAYDSMPQFNASGQGALDSRNAALPV